MNNEDFETLVAKTRLRATASGMARRVFVDGWSAADAAREVGRTRSEASRAVGIIRAAAIAAARLACPKCGRPW